jgi:DNA-binding NtrC family response regulator
MEQSRSATAEVLGISISSLYRKMEELGITKSAATVPQAV